VKSLPEEDRFTRLRTERKHFIDTIKMICLSCRNQFGFVATRTSGPRQRRCAL
jgi:hypothetical protein